MWLKDCEVTSSTTLREEIAIVGSLTAIPHDIFYLSQACNNREKELMILALFVKCVSNWQGGHSIG